MVNVIALSILLLVAAAGGGYQYKRTRRKRAQRRLSERIWLSIDSFRDCLANPHEIGRGNIGMVVEAELCGDWEKRLGIRWRTPDEFPKRVAVKIARFKKHSQRLNVLIGLADQLQKARNDNRLPSICPFLALGQAIDPDSGEIFIVEIMERIEGESLKSWLGGNSPDFRQTLDRLLSILDTVTFLESFGYYTRNLDLDNVLVEPDGRWVRIDFDNAHAIREFPLRRMRRLAGLTRRVIEKIKTDGRDAERDDLFKRLRATEALPIRNAKELPVPDRLRPWIIRTPEELIERVRGLRDRTASIR